MPEDNPTIDINGLEIFSAGTFNNDVYSEADLDAMVSAFDQVGFKPTVKAGHADGQELADQARKVFGAPALGYATKIYRSGKKLLADLTKVPRRFADLIKKGAYSRVSSEIYWNYADAGTKYPRVLKSIAFLGADIPALTNLKEIELLYQRSEGGAYLRYDENNNEIRLAQLEVAPSPPAALSPTVSREHPKDELWLTYAEMNEVCESCAKRMEFANLSEVKVGFYDKAGEFHFAMNMPENTIKGMCDKFGEASGFRTRCMGHMEGKGVDPGAFCNALKAECHGSVTKESSQKQKPKSNTGGRMAEKTLTVSQEELDELIKQRVDAMTADKEKEYEYRVIKAREEGKLEKEKEAEALRAEVRKLAMEKRSEQIQNWLSNMKEAGKISPAEEGRVRALREWIPDEAEKVKIFEQQMGKVRESEDSPAKIFESLFESRNSVFKTFSKGGEDPETREEPLDDPGAELDRLAKKYQEEQAAHGTKISYTDAFRVTQKKNPVLAQKYNSTRN